VRILISLLLVSASAGELAYADATTVATGPQPAWVVPSEAMPVPADASGAGFVRRQDVVVHVGKQGELIYSGYWLKILHPNALQAGNIGISWNPAAGQPVVHAINVYRGTEVFDVLKTGSFEILRREDQLEQARLDGVLTAVLKIPDLRVGDELEVSFTTPANDPTLGNTQSGLLFLGQTPLSGRYRLELNWDEGFEPRTKMTPDFEPVAIRAEKAITFRFDNPSLLSPPKDAPPRYQFQRLLEFSDFPDWPAVSRQFAPLYAQASKLSAKSDVKAEATRIAATRGTALERMSAALKLVQQDVRYIYVGLDRGNLTPASAEETWQRRYGDCKAKTVLLLALLRELGIPAEAVLANNSGLDDGLDGRLPNPRVFDHVLVRAAIGNKLYWLDGTLPPVVSPGLVPTIPYRWVLAISERGSGIERLERRPMTRPDEILLYEIDARLGFDRPAHVTTTDIVRGVKGLTQYVQFSPVTKDQLLTVMRQQLTGSSWQTVDDVKWRYDERAQASILVVSGTSDIQWEDDGSGAKSLALPGGGFNPPNKRGRSADQNQDVPYYNAPEYNCHVTTVRIPTTTKLDHWSHKSGFDVHIFGKNYYRAFDRRDDTIRMVRGFRVEQEELSAATAQKDNSRIASFDNSMGYVFYDPASVTSGQEGSKPVPTTFDLDWTENDVPCLSESALAHAPGAGLRAPSE